ncbi:hypothetical protein B0H15DRAFT_800091 [Mycena belliarum]|uniref:Uncharacterized protein n=1 Tax=Mycena belliarum TaxID=1033014 RepID=A0AAD6XVJ6_9AGAR|nr:hypothetical protein B0H15DRAFT_800091 [Mycena belliae]
MSVNTTSRSGIPLPLPPTFDCDTYATRPVDNPAPAGMELEDKNAANVVIEMDNKASIALTRAYAAALATTAGVGALDVGAPLKGLWTYTDDEKAALLHSPEYVAAVGPLPLALLKLIAQHRAAIGVQREKERAEKEAEKVKTANLLGSMVYTNAHDVTPLLRQSVVIPTIFLVSLRHKVYFPLHWWTDSLLRKAAESPHTICKEFSRAEQSASYSIGERVQVVDVTKCAKLFDGEDESKSLTPSLWRQAANNLLSAFKQLCPAVDPTDPHTRNYASEFAAHFTWFSNLECFDTKMEVWLPIERKLRYALLGQGYFKELTWADEVRSVLSAHEHAAALAIKYPSASPPVGTKRLSADDGDGVVKRARREGPWRSDEGGGSQTQRGPPVCLLCTGPHLLADHPQNTTSFRDGATLFSKQDGRNVRTTGSFRGNAPKVLCILFNARGRCDGGHPERLHACSLCGGEHSAITRHDTCKRVRNGAFVP